MVDGQPGPDDANEAAHRHSHGSDAASGAANTGPAPDAGNRTDSDGDDDWPRMHERLMLAPRNAFVVLDLDDPPLTMSWLPGLPTRRPRTAIDPMVGTD